MDFTAMSIMQGVLLLFILIGLLFGIWKGFGKSVIRLFTVLAMAVICFFCSPPIAKALATTDISGLGLNIAGVQIVTVSDGIIALLQKIKVVNELMTASPTFASFIEVIPLFLLNLVVFFLFYLVLMAFSHLFSWLIAKFTLKKHKKGEHKRYRLLGGLVGVVQAVLVFAILAMPVFGIADTIDAALKASESDSTSSSTAATASHGNEEYTLLSSTVATESKTNDTQEKIDEIKDTVSPYVSQYKNTIFVKAFKALGISAIDAKVYNKLTTETVNHEKVNLKNEIVVVSEASAHINAITNLSEKSTAQDFDEVKAVVKSLFKSSLISRIAEETINYTATEWLDESDPVAFGIQKPNVGSLASDLFDAVLGQLKNVERETLENDLVKVAEVGKITADKNVLSSFSGSSDSEKADNLLDALKTDGTVSSIILKMTESTTLKAIIPEAVQVAMNSIYDAIGGISDRVNIQTTTLTDAEWAQESQTIETIVKNFVLAYDSTKVEEGESVFDNFDFNALGNVFNAMRDSIILDGRDKETAPDNRTSFSIVKTLLQSGLMEGISVTDGFINTLRSGWTKPENEFSFVTAFGTLKSAVSIMQTFNDNLNLGEGEEAQPLDPDVVSGLIDGLASESGSTIVKMITNNILANGETSGEGDNQEIGNSTLSQAVQDIASAIRQNAKNAVDNAVNGEEAYNADNEAAALNTALDLLNQTNSATEESAPVTITGDQVDDILKSEIIYNSIIDAATEEDEEGNKTPSELGQNIIDATEDNTDLAGTIIEKYNDASTPEEKAKINEFYKILFGTDIDAE